MNHTHTCRWCEQSYPGTTLLVEGETEDGRPVASCECQVTDECPGCSEHGACEDCGKAPAGDERDYFRCTPCAQKRIDNFDLPSDWEPDYGAVGLVELQDRARDGKR